MSTAPETSENPEAKKLETEVEKTIEQIEKQEAKVENASTEAEEKKEASVLNQLLEKFDGLTERLGKIETRLAEPTVPAPTAKEAPAPEAAKAPEGEVETKGESEAPPRRRRLGAW